MQYEDNTKTESSNRIIVTSSDDESKPVICGRCFKPNGYLLLCDSNIFDMTEDVLVKTFSASHTERNN